MNDSFKAKHAKSVSAKQIKRSLLKLGEKSAPEQPITATAAVVEWTKSMLAARESAETLWKSYLTEDPEAFDATIKRLDPDSRAMKLLLDKAYQARSPDVASELGAASASRYEPVKAAIRNDWMTAQEKGYKKSKRQFVRDWSHKQIWTATWLRMSAKSLYNCLPKSKS